MTRWPDGTRTLPNVSSRYGDPRPGSPTGIHNGVDFTGFASVRAVEAGVVKFAGWNNAMGNIVYASHADDTYRSRSCHMRYTPNVRTGQWFGEAALLGQMGDTGSESRGIHLHFDIYVRGSNGYWVRTDPVRFLSDRMASTAGGNPKPLEDIMNADQEKKLDTVLSRAGWVKDRIAGSMTGASITDLLRSNISLTQANGAAITALADARGVDVQPILDAIKEASTRPVPVVISPEQQEAIAAAVAERVIGDDTEAVKSAVREVFAEAFGN